MLFRIYSHTTTIYVLYVRFGFSYWDWKRTEAVKYKNIKWKMIKNYVLEWVMCKVSSITTAINVWMNGCVHVSLNPNINCCWTIKMRGKSHKDVNSRRVSRRLLLTATQLLSSSPAIQIQIMYGLGKCIWIWPSQGGRLNFHRQNNSIVYTKCN